VDVEFVEAARLRLERWTDSHTTALIAMNLEPDVTRFLGGGGAPMSEAESRRQSARLADHWERFGIGLWAVIDRAHATVCGFAGLSHPLWFPANAAHTEVGWRLHPRAWGRGYATEAGGAGLRVAFEVLGIEEVVAYIAAANEPSAAVARRLGMTYRHTVAHPSRDELLEVFAIDRAVWSTPRPSSLAWRG
jgi:RimJ/RimL family protein N-acetyltransferase